MRLLRSHLPRDLASLAIAHACHPKVRNGVYVKGSCDIETCGCVAGPLEVWDKGENKGPIKQFAVVGDSILVHTYRELLDDGVRVGAVLSLPLDGNEDMVAMMRERRVEEMTPVRVLNGRQLGDVLRERGWYHL